MSCGPSGFYGGRLGGGSLESLHGGEQSSEEVEVAAGNANGTD